MIKEIRNNINNIIKMKKVLLSIFDTELLIVYIIYLKYLCEIGKYKYEEVMFNNELYDIVKLSAYSKIKVEDQAFEINKILHNYQSVKAKDMLLELLNSKEARFNFYAINDKRVVYVMGRIMHVNSSEYFMYDLSGNTTYVYKEKMDSLYECFKIFDEILGIHNEYKKFTEIDFSQYDNLCVYNNIPKYNKEYRDFNMFIYNEIPVVKNVILYSKYLKVSNFKEGRMIAKYIKTIVIKDDDIVIVFNQDAKEISIINGNNPIVSNIDELDRVIKNNRKQKDVLVKINYQELSKNGMRIGFNLYQMEKMDNKIDVNKIVDENTRYLNNLNSLNEIVERETNKIFNL